MQFAIFRVSEKKYKSINDIKGYERHVERLQPTLNANRLIENIRLVGTASIVKNVQEYIKGIKLRSNAVLAREVLLTASPEFMQTATKEVKKQWIAANLEFLKNEFGDNIIYSTGHLDEKSLHISSLMVPRFENEKGYLLANRRYFNGKQALSEWQDKYSEAMKPFGLCRGIKWSKGTHVNIKAFYSLVNSEINEKDLENLCAKAKDNILLKDKVKKLQTTLRAYKNYNEKTEEEKLILCNEVKSIKHDKEVFRQCIKTLSNLYKIPQNHIEKIVDYVIKNEAKEKDQGKELELTK